MKRILIRADSSSAIGTGHIMRDLVLAQQYGDSEVIFATQDLEGNLNSKILESGYEVQNLKSNDVDELIKVVQKLAVDMVIIDHYDIGYKFEKALKKAYPTITILAFDDTYEKHYCDILLNHNISGDEKRYENLVPKWCEIRCGEVYTLLRDEFIKEKRKKTIFLAMGGSDSNEKNIPILEVLNTFNDIKVHLITTTANSNLKELKAYMKNRDWIKLHVNSRKIAKLMKKSDIAIITPSVTANEAVYMELDLIAIKVAENQNDMYRYLKKYNYCVLKKFNELKLMDHLVKKGIV